MMVEPGEPADENDPGSDGDMEHDSDEAEIDALAREVGIVSSVDAGVIPEADGLDVAAHDVWDIFEQHDETKTAAAQAKRSMASGGGSAVARIVSTTSADPAVRDAVADLVDPDCRRWRSTRSSVQRCADDAEGGDGASDASLKLVHWDSYNPGVSCESRWVAVDGTKVNCTDPGWGRRHIHDLTEAIATNRIRMVIPNTGVHMLRRSGRFRAEMDKSVLSFIRFVQDCEESILAVATGSAPVMGSAPPCHVCGRILCTEEHTRVCPLCCTSSHVSCVHDLAMEALADHAAAQLACDRMLTPTLQRTIHAVATCPILMTRTAGASCTGSSPKPSRGAVCKHCQMAYL